MLLLQSLVLPNPLVVSRMATTGTAMDQRRRLVLPRAHLRVLPQVRLRVPEVMKAVLEQLECRFPCLLDCRLSLLDSMFDSRSRRHETVCMRVYGYACVAI